MAGSAVVVITSHCPSRAAENQNMKIWGLVRLENKQSGNDLNDHRRTKREALMSSLGCLGLGGRMMAA